MKLPPLRRVLLSFGSLHAANALWAMGHTLLQLVVLARVLPGPDYTAVVGITAVALYLQPISQACARANYVALRAHMTEGSGGRTPPEVTAFLYVSLAVSLTAAVVLSVVLVGATSSVSKLALWLFLFASILNNTWYYDLQFSLWAVDFTRKFEVLSFGRRVLLVLCLVPLFFTGNFLLFTILTNVVTLLAMVVLVWSVPNPDFLLPGNLRHLTRPLFAVQVRRFGAALLSTLSELTVFNAPYAIIVYALGVGPALVAFDSVLKLTRVGLTLTRNISEIVLPYQSRARSTGDVRHSMRLFGLSLAAALGLNGVIAACLLAAGGLVFQLMLGPNNVLPAGAGVPAAAIQIAATFYGATSFFLAFTGHDRQIVWLTGVAAALMVAFAGVVIVLHPAILPMLSAYAVCLSLTALASVIFVLPRWTRNARVVSESTVGSTGRT